MSLARSDIIHGDCQVLPGDGIMRNGELTSWVIVSILQTMLRWPGFTHARLRFYQTGRSCLVSTTIADLGKVNCMLYGWADEDQGLSLTIESLLILKEPHV